MKKAKAAELVFGLVLIGLVYTVISNNVTITGNVINTPEQLTLISPKDNAELSPGDNYFMFGYDADAKMSSCTLMFDDKPAKTINSLLSPSGTRMKVTLEPGTYFWKISCTDELEQKYESTIQKINIQQIKQDGFVKTTFFDKTGNIYEFEISENLDIMLGNIIAGDTLRAKRGSNEYYVNIVQISQDYSSNTEFADLFVTPGDKRVHLTKGQSANIDFNNDEKDDVIIGLKDISFRAATITVKSPSLMNNINQESATTKQPGIQAPSIVISQQQETQPKINQQQPIEIKEMPAPQIQNSNNQAYMIINYIVLVIIVFLIIGIIILRNKKKEREQAKISAISNIKQATAQRQKSKQKPGKKKR